MNWTKRTELLWSAATIEKFSRAHVLVVGLGGVGAVAAEYIVRGGIGQVTIVDDDIIEPTNINRQLPALHSTLGHKKVDVMAERLLEINPELKIHLYDEFLRDERTLEILNTRFHYVVDAIDTLAPKVFLIYHSLNAGYPIISSMGSGGKSNPSIVSVTDIRKTHHCQLARMVRKRLHKLGVHKGFRAVFSPEEVKKNAVVAETSTNKASNVGTVSYMPAIFGCYCASEVLTNLR